MITNEHVLQEIASTHQQPQKFYQENAQMPPAQWERESNHQESDKKLGRATSTVDQLGTR